MVALRSEPKTLNPVIANDISSREVIGQMTADLIHINRYTQLSESALAKSWKVSSDERRYTLELRHDLRFSDGAPLDADDVVFSFKVYLDERVNAPQRDSLLVGETPITVRKVDPYTVTFTLARPYASAERLFDSVAILPRHLLERAYSEGKLAQAWTLDTPPDRIAGLGPFRLKEYVPGQRLTLERNPYYWKRDRNRRSSALFSRDYVPVCRKRRRAKSYVLRQVKRISSTESAPTIILCCSRNELPAVSSFMTWVRTLNTIFCSSI